MAKVNGRGANASKTDTDAVRTSESVFAEMSYEVASAQLEEILTKLESDDLPLDDSLTLYEHGMALVGHCTQLLDSATLRVQQWQDDETTTEFDGWQEG